MELQLHKAEFFFSDDNNHFKVSFIAFEDGTHSVYVFRLFPNSNDMKCIGTYDTESKKPEWLEAFSLLHKTIRVNVAG